jgi:hypothetical protein
MSRKTRVIIFAVLLAGYAVLFWAGVRSGKPGQTVLDWRWVGPAFGCLIAAFGSLFIGRRRH